MLKKSKKEEYSRRAKKTYSPAELKPHHARPFRKRHYGLLILSVLLTVGLLYLLITNVLINRSEVKSVKEVLARALNQSSSEQSNDLPQVSSTYGLSITYNPKILLPSATSSKDNKLYSGSELNIQRPYSTIRLSALSSDSTSGTANGSLTVQYYLNDATGNSADLVKLEAQLVGASNPNLAISESSETTISGVTFVKSDWKSASVKGGVTINDKSATRITSFIGLIDGIPVTIIRSYGLAEGKNTQDSFNESLKSIKFEPTTSSATILTPSDISNISESSDLSLLDRLAFTQSVSAESFLNKDNSSERVSLLYSPSVVKIYNFYCMDIVLNNKPFATDNCSATTGSGFFVGDKGYVATNGHVVVNDPLSIAITYAFDQASKGNMFYFSELAQAAGLTQADIDAAPTDKDKVKVAVEKLYKIPSTKLSAVNKTENILVGLGERQPDLQQLLNSTRSRQIYQAPSGVKKAQLVGYNYRAIDGAQTGQFEASDVALLKIDGNNYPTTKLGSISGIMQGSGLNIIGYPGAASSNPLVDSSESRATLTSGKVSSIKNATGSKSQMIETDATIGHGNSGGPAFNDSGEVVGIATYTIDGSGDGNGVFNYVRDVADLKDLASKNNVDLSSQSQTQQEWESAAKDIYQAHYAKALGKLESVKALYPEHPRVDQLIALVQQRINAGEGAKEFPTSIIALASLFGISLIVISILLIVHHSRKHAAYNEHLASGAISQSSDPHQT